MLGSRAWNALESGRRGGALVATDAAKILDVAAVAATRRASGILGEPALEVPQMASAAAAGARDIEPAHEVVAHHAPGICKHGAARAVSDDSRE